MCTTLRILWHVAHQSGVLQVGHLISILRSSKANNVWIHLPMHLVPTTWPHRRTQPFSVIGSLSLSLSFPAGAMPLTLMRFEQKHLTSRWIDGFGLLSCFKTLGQYVSVMVGGLVVAVVVVSIPGPKPPLGFTVGGLKKSTSRNLLSKLARASSGFAKLVASVMGASMAGFVICLSVGCPQNASESNRSWNSGMWQNLVDLKYVVLN